VDIQNQALSGGTTSNAILSSNGGLSVDQFKGVENNNVSLWLRARNRGDQGPMARVGDTFKIRPDANPSTTDNDDFSFEFQFSPEDGSLTDDNYWLELKVDGDPGAATDFTTLGATLSAPIFDADSIDGNSWDDGDSLVIDGVTSRGGNTVDFAKAISSSRDENNLPEYVVVNSWLPKWGFLLDGTPGPGLYDITLNAYSDDPNTTGTLLATNTITAQVVPTPAALPAGLALMGLLTLRRRR